MDNEEKSKRLEIPKNCFSSGAQRLHSCSWLTKLALLEVRNFKRTTNVTISWYVVPLYCVSVISPSGYKGWNRRTVLWEIRESLLGLTWKIFSTILGIQSLFLDVLIANTKQ